MCEGQSTEPEYIRKFAQEQGFSVDHLECIPGPGTPMTVVDRAIQEKNRLVNERRRGVPHEIWAVFDRDEHPYVNEARQKARDNQIRVAFSNPCVELWALYHFDKDQNAPIHHDAAAKALREKMPNYDPDKGKVFDYEQMKKHYQTACNRAKKGRANREREGDPHGNPSTSMDELTERIIELAEQKPLL
ncbi:MAG: RloB domain-containing protein [Magnetococcales bacterium]|nr:RloB domain-containing protein [Magnetococcales bacterium]